MFHSFVACRYAVYAVAAAKRATLAYIRHIQVQIHNNPPPLKEKEKNKFSPFSNTQGEHM